MTFSLRRNAARRGALLLLPLFLVLVLPAGGGRPPTAAAATKRPPQLSHQGRFLTDPAGRVVLIHGVNAVYKRAPYVAPATARGFTERDARFLSRHGINAVRLGVLFAGVMPEPGRIDRRYLRRVDRIVRLLADRKIWVLLDFHQDAFNEKFSGEGFPDWAVNDDGLPFVDLGDFFLNGQTPAVQRNYDHLWNNDSPPGAEEPMWDYYRQAWVAVARKWRDQPYLMGYDLINEPNAGTQMATCANPVGCPVFDATLQSFYDAIREGIRSVDHRNLVWYEPQYLFNAVSSSHFTAVDDPAVGFSWHLYACTPAFVEGGILPSDLDCQVNEPRVMDNADAQVDTMGAGGLLTEFGAGDDLEDLSRILGYADDHLTGWMYWQYKHWNDPTGNDEEGLFRKDAKLRSVKKAKLALLSRPYPQAIAGIPTAMSWDPQWRVLQFTFTPDRSTGLTDVFVSRRDRFDVHVTGGHVVPGGGRQHVLIAAKPGASTVSVVLLPDWTSNAR